MLDFMDFSIAELSRQLSQDSYKIVILTNSFIYKVFLDFNKEALSFSHRCQTAFAEDQSRFET